MVGGSLPLEPQIIGRICGSAERMLARTLNWGRGRGAWDAGFHHPEYFTSGTSLQY